MYNLLEVDFLKFTNIEPNVNRNREDLVLRIYSNILKSLSKEFAKISWYLIK